MLGFLLGTADANLTSSLNQVTTYFTNNIGVTITAVIGIVAFLWLLKMGLHSFGVRRSKTIT